MLEKVPVARPQCKERWEAVTPAAALVQAKDKIKSIAAAAEEVGESSLHVDKTS